MPCQGFDGKQIPPVESLYDGGRAMDEACSAWHLHVLVFSRVILLWPTSETYIGTLTLGFGSCNHAYRFIYVCHCIRSSKNMRDFAICQITCFAAGVADVDLNRNVLGVLTAEFPLRTALGSTRSYDAPVCVQCGTLCVVLLNCSKRTVAVTSRSICRAMCSHVL